MDFQTLLRKRRSIREFEKKAVSLDTVREIIKEACLAPSAMNGQPWDFVIITRGEVMKRLSDESKKNLLSDLARNPDSPLKRYETILRDNDFNVFYDAPCLVYIVGRGEIRSLDVDCALFACYFMMSAAARGLGTCWIGLGAHIRNADVRREIGIPEEYRIVAPIVIGYPKSIPQPSERNDPRILKIID